MDYPNYKIENNQHIRRTNWRNFVHQIKWQPNHKIAILTLHFNHFENIKNLLNYLKKEKNQNFDVIFIENSTTTEEKEKLLTYSKSHKHCTIITPITNVGSAGGYALGMEYILTHSYEYFFVVEDDIFLQQEQTFSEMIRYANQQTLTLINSCKNTRSSPHPIDKGKSRRVQLAGYPTSFIKEIGIIDPRNFFRAEDLERGERIETWIKNYHYQIKIVDHNYLHPYLKPLNKNYTRLYFSVRNQIFRFTKSNRKKWKLFVVLFFYLRTGTSKILIEWNAKIFKAFFWAIRDFLCNNFSFQHNQKKIKEFIASNSHLEVKRTENSKISRITKEYFSTDTFLQLSWIDKDKLQYSKKLSHFFRKGVVTSSNATIFYPIFILAPKVICINEFDLQTERISYSTYQSHALLNMIRKWWSCVITFLVSLWGILMISLPILRNIMIKKKEMTL